MTTWTIWRCAISLVVCVLCYFLAVGDGSDRCQFHHRSRRRIRENEAFRVEGDRRSDHSARLHRVQVNVKVEESCFEKYRPAMQ